MFNWPAEAAVLIIQQQLQPATQLSYTYIHTY